MAKHHILIVDDDHDLVNMLGHLLREKGYETSTAFDGYEALEKTWEHHPDLVILDVNLPKLTGFQVCRILRIQRESKHTPILMLTGRTLEGSYPEGFQEGTDSYITKPYEPTHLLTLIQMMLAHTVPSS